MLRLATLLSLAVVLGLLGERGDVRPSTSDEAPFATPAAVWIFAITAGAYQSVASASADHRHFALERRDATYGAATYVAAVAAVEGLFVVGAHGAGAWVYGRVARLPDPTAFAVAASLAAVLHHAIVFLSAAVAPNDGVASLVVTCKFFLSFATANLFTEKWINHFSTFKLAFDSMVASQDPGRADTTTSLLLGSTAVVLCFAAAAVDTSHAPHEPGEAI